MEFKSNTIDVGKNPFAYNVDFDPTKPAHFTAWLNMRPTHISEVEWPLQVARLKLCLESNAAKTPRDRAMVILGWKSQNGLLPPNQE